MLQCISYWIRSGTLLVSFDHRYKKIFYSSKLAYLPLHCLLFSPLTSPIILSGTWIDIGYAKWLWAGLFSFWGMPLVWSWFGLMEFDNTCSLKRKKKVSYLQWNDACTHQGNESPHILWWRKCLGIRGAFCTCVAGFNMHRFSAYM